MDNISVKQLGNFEAYNSPWARFYARTLDYAIIGQLLNIFMADLVPGYMAETVTKQSAVILVSLFSSVISTFIWVFIESLLLAYVGFTPGKLLLNIRLVTQDNKKLSLKKAFNRSMLVWTKGVALGIPVIQLFTMYSQYRLLKDDQPTTWDNLLAITCICDLRRFINIILIAILLIIVYISYLLLYKDFSSYGIT